MIKVHVWTCGSTRVDEALPLANRSRNPFAFTGIGRSSKNKITVPVRTYFIEHPKARILIDTGWDTFIRENALEYEGFFNHFISPGELPANEAVTEHLARVGYKAEDLDYCILTHMDIDHVGGIRLVRNAKKIMVSQAEWNATKTCNPRYRRKLWEKIHIETFPDEVVDLLGDGTIQLIPMYGHSAGMTAVRVGTSEQYLIIAGDAGYLRDSWMKEILPGVTWNKKKTKISLHKLHQYGMDEKCKAILMTHDIEKLSLYYELK